MSGMLSPGGLNGFGAVGCLDYVVTRAGERKAHHLPHGRRIVNYQDECHSQPR
jgi:hypothetical protein